MALVNLTNVNPYEVDRRQNIAASAALGQNISQGLQSIAGGFAKAKAKADEEAKKLKEEQVENNKKLSKNLTENFGDLNQTLEDNNFMQETFIKDGQQTMKDYTELYNQLENPDNTPEDVARITASMDSLKARGENLNSALTNLETTTSSIKEMIANNTVSPGTDPSIVSFVTEMDDPELKKNYTLDTDEEGNRYIVGKTQGGEDIKLSIDKLASGENQLRVLPDKPLHDFTKGVADIVLKDPVMEVGTNEIGLEKHVNAAAAGKIAGAEVTNILKDETSFRQIASGYGFGYNKIKALQEGGAIEEGFDEAGESGPNEDVDLSDGINSEEELKGYLANMMVMEVGSDPRITEVTEQVDHSIYKQNLIDAKNAEIKAEQDEILKQKQIAKDNIKLSRVNNIQNSVSDKGDFKYLKQFESQKTVNGQNILQIKKNKDNPNLVEIIYEGHTKNSPKFDKFDLGTQEGAISLESILPKAPTASFNESVVRKSQQYFEGLD